MAAIVRGDTRPPATKLPRVARPLAPVLSGVMVMMVVMMVMVPLGKRGRSGNHRKEQNCSQNLLHKGHPSTA
jgi:hypothetical protein